MNPAVNMSLFKQLATDQFDAISSPARHGWLGEALVFQYLQQSPVVRSAEFAPVDRAIFLGQELLPDGFHARLKFAENDGLAERYVNFNVKSKHLQETRDDELEHRSLFWRVSVITAFQKSNCAFIIVVFKSPLGGARQWAALVPIHLYDGLMAQQSLTKSELYLWSPVDPALYPYTFPVDWLPRVVSDVRDAALAKSNFTNPWNRVTLPNWIPQRSTPHALHSLNTSPQALASRRCISWIEAAVEKYASGLLSAARDGRCFRLEMNDVVPLLGDFVLIGLDGEPYLIEHKTR